jgi:hypothetical protein
VAGPGLGTTNVTDRTGALDAVPRGPLRILLGLVAIALAGAAAFGLWHVVVGGLINGNPRAATFGVVLALATGLPLIAGAWLIRRRRPSPG